VPSGGEGGHEMGGKWQKKRRGGNGEFEAQGEIQGGHGRGSWSTDWQGDKNGKKREKNGVIKKSHGRDSRQEKRGKKEQLGC